MGGNARWTAVAIRMDGGGEIKMDRCSGNGQQRHNRRLNDKTNTMGKAVGIDATQDRW
jgi:hypothetical protein